MVRPYKPIDRSAAHDIWFCHAPKKKIEKTGYTQEIQDTILSINDTEKFYNEPIHNGAKRTLRLSDDEVSPYMKTILDGGIKDLLEWKKESDEKTQQVCNIIPEWYCHAREEKRESQKPMYEQVIPDWFVHDQDKEDDEEPMRIPRIVKRPVYGWDTLSTWKRGEKEQNESKITTNIERKGKKKAQKTRDRTNQGKSKQTELKLPLIIQQPRNNERSESFGKWYSKWYIEKHSQPSKKFVEISSILH